MARARRVWWPLLCAAGPAAPAAAQGKAPRVVKYQATIADVK